MTLIVFVDAPCFPREYLYSIAYCIAPNRNYTRFLLLTAAGDAEEEELESEQKDVKEVGNTGTQRDIPRPQPNSAGSSLQSYYATPETHAAYAFTWFSISIISLVISYYNFRKSPAAATRAATKAAAKAAAKASKQL